MMHGHEKSDLVIVAKKPANKAKEAHCGGVCGGERSGVGGAKAGAKGNTHQHNTYWTQSQARVTNALERIRPLSPSHTRGGSRMRESRTYGSVRGACDETHVPTATPPRGHHAARGRGGLAARGTGTAGRPLPTIGFLGESTQSGQRQWAAAFVQRLRELGWIEGRNFAIEYRWAEGRNERFAELVSELVRLKVDAIL